MVAEVIKHPLIEACAVQKKDSSRNKNEYHQSTDKQTDYYDHFYW